MFDYGKLAKEYETQIEVHRKRIGELKEALKLARTGKNRDELGLRIAYLDDEINLMYDSINTMKQYA